MDNFEILNHLEDNEIVKNVKLFHVLYAINAIIVINDDKTYFWS